MPPFHPDLAATARWLPRSMGRPAIAAIVKRLMPFAMARAASVADTNRR